MRSLLKALILPLILQGFIGLTPSGQLVNRLVSMLLSYQILIGRTIAGVTFIRRKVLLNPLLSGAGGAYAYLMHFIFE